MLATMLRASSAISLSTVLPAITGDNVIYEEDVTVSTGWSSFVTSDGTWQTYTPNGSTSSNVIKSIAGPSAGDYIFYATLRGDSLVPNNVFNFALGALGSEAFIISLGYNRETAAYEQNRVSVKIGSTGVQGPLIDYSANDIEIAVQYDARTGDGSLYIRESGVWKFYGGASMPSPYKNDIRYGSGGGNDMSATIKEAFIAYPNIVAIGDSITAGHNAFDPDVSYYSGDDDYDSTWMAHAQIYGNVRNNLIVNYGIGGNDTAEVAARVGAMLTNTQPQVVFLSACNNDYNTPISAAQRTINLQSSIDLIDAQSIPVVLYNAIYPNSTAANYPAQLNFYRDWWTDNKDDLTDVYIYIDINVDIDGGDGAIDPSYTSDGVHPNVAGYTAIGNYIESLE